MYIYIYHPTWISELKMLATMYWPLVTRVLLKGDGHDISWGCKIVTCQYMSYNSYPNCKHDISTWYIVYYFPHELDFGAPVFMIFFGRTYPEKANHFMGIYRVPKSGTLSDLQKLNWWFLKRGIQKMVNEKGYHWVPPFSLLTMFFN